MVLWLIGFLMTLAYLQEFKKGEVGWQEHLALLLLWPCCVGELLARAHTNHSTVDDENTVLSDSQTQLTKTVKKSGRHEMESGALFNALAHARGWSGHGDRYPF